MVMAQWSEDQGTTIGYVVSALQDVVTIAWLSLVATTQSLVACLIEWSMADHTTTMVTEYQASLTQDQEVKDLATARDRTQKVKSEK